MATVLTAQLAQIQSQAINPLDLKAQRKAHSKSLLFEPNVAATQDFDSIYQLCHEGFEELCGLDSRFLRFADTIFSEQSKSQDRGQMTSTQNIELDAVLEDFILLVGGRLALKPALKSVEWLVRRFRVHENNTLSLILSFLPHHMTPSFTNMLSILPVRIPEQVKFLHPYIQSIANPPRHTIVYSASSTKSFLKALSGIVLRSCSMGYQYPALILFWASITTEAVGIMIDQAQSTRREAQRQNQEDVLMFILPILNDGISVKDSSSLRIGCYMILTVLASKADLEEDVLTAMMEAVVSDWQRTSHAGLICLAVLAQRRWLQDLPGKVLDAVLCIPNLDQDLKILQKEYQVDNLVLGIIVGMLDGLKKSGDCKELPRIRMLLESNMTHERSFHMALNTILLAIDELSVTEHSNSNLQGYLTDLVISLSDSEQFGNQIQNAVRDSKLHLTYLRQRFQNVTERSESRNPILERMQISDMAEQTAADDFDVIVGHIPAEMGHEISFLSRSESDIYGILMEAFCSIHTSNANLERFSDLPVLRKSLATNEPLFISFYIRLWCGSSPATARAAALQTVTMYLGSTTPTNDLQIVLPYVIYALSDPSLLVRRAAADLVLTLSHANVRNNKTNERPEDTTLFSREHIYGQNDEVVNIHWLSVKDSMRLVADLLVPYLEECLLDHQATSHLLSVAITGSKISKVPNTKAYPELKTSLRLSIFSFLCSHVVNSPLYTFKMRLLRTLNKVERVGTTSRTKLLLPLLADTTKLGHERLLRACQGEQIEILELLPLLTGMVTSSDREGVQMLKHVVETVSFEPLQVSAIQRMSPIWPHLKPDLQLSLAEVLVDLAAWTGLSNDGETLQIAAIETLQSLRISTAVLHHLLTLLPALSIHSEEEPTAAKRRRLSRGDGNINVEVGHPRAAQEIRRITLVLELIESPNAEQHPSLLKGLFQVVIDLQNAQSQAGNATSYLQILAMDSMLAIVKKAADAPDLSIDGSTIRMDALIDYVRTVGNPQARNSAFLLIAALADIFPKLVLHSVMPIFTYMGANLLRQEDSFSAYVVRQTMESVVPHLVHSLHSGSTDAFAGVCELLLNFAAAFEHIPQQRRLEIFTSLVAKVGALDYLFALFAILLDRYPGNKSVLDLSLLLAGHQQVSIQLQTIEKLLIVVLDAWNPASTELPISSLLDQGHSPQAITINLLPLAICAFQSKRLLLKISKLLPKRTPDAAAVREAIAKIFEHVFLLSETCKDDTRLNSLCTQLLESSLDLLPIQEMVLTLEGLLNRVNNDLSRKILQSFEHRLNIRSMNVDGARESCLAFIPRLASITREPSDAILKQTAVSAIQRIVERFGKTDLSKVLEAGQSISSETCLGAEEVSLRVASLLCLAKMVEVSGETIVPLVPTALPIVGENLAMSINEDVENRSLHNACYSVFQALLLSVPWMITGHDLDRILRLSFESASTEMGNECDDAREKVLQSITKEVEVNVLFAALERTWATAVIHGLNAVNDYFEVLHLAINRHPKSLIVHHSGILGDIFLKAFDLRRAQLCPPTDDSYDDDEITEVETNINETAIAMIYKLNDASFRPMFHRILEWATDARKDRQNKICQSTSWYTFLDHFFNTLKSIVTSYAEFIIEDAIEILSNVRPKEKDCMQLWRKVIQTLQRTFEYDQDGFYQAPSHFTPVSVALMSQLSHAAEIPMNAEVIPAIAELAVASDSSTQHRELNAAILRHMRSDIVAIRLAAVQCERALTDRLGEEWLTLLPEMLPFISELQEDDDETVEKETLRWISRMEEILGESLTPMLQ